MRDSTQVRTEPERGTAAEVFLVFLRLGCVCFGGPIAHLGYFQEELVRERRWCDQNTYAETIALAQSLPGPSSSQVCFAMGVLRAGWMGGAAAWIAFTLPSALLMLAFAFGVKRLSSPLGSHAVHGLQLVAVGVVGQAVLTMQRALAPDRERMAVALAALSVVLFGPPRFATLMAIAIGGVAGVLLLPSAPLQQHTQFETQTSRRGGAMCAAVLLALLVSLPVLAHLLPGLAVHAVSAFYTCGALVFGGGHVVLPLLEQAVVAPGWVKESVFLSGYGAAQALPGPLFTFGAFLGASLPGTSHRVWFGLLGLMGLSAPGLLAMGAVLPFWQSWRELRWVQMALRGVNAAVVGVLLAALFTPLWTSTVRNASDFWIVLLAFALLTQWKLQPIAVAGVCVGISVASMAF